MAARASIVGACETSVGKVREHNEDSHFLDVERGIFAVCDGMGGHAAGEVASELAVRVIHERWSSADVERVADAWVELGTPEARKQMLAEIEAGVVAAHDSILHEADRDKSKHGMGTTVVGALVLGGDIVFAHSGDSRAYIVRDNIAMQLTEDHTLLARLLAAGVEVDTSNEGSRFKSMLTNALGIGQDCKAATFIVPIASGDKFLLCSDGITEYVQEVEIGEVLSQQPSPARAAQKLVELALARGGADNATALVVKVIEAGETARPVAQLQADDKVIGSCPLFAKCTKQGVLRARRITLPRDHASGERIPAQTLGDRVAWIILDGEVELPGGNLMGPGGLLYPEALVPPLALPDKHGLGVAAKDVRALAVRADDFREICADDPELGERLTEALEALTGPVPAPAPEVDELEHAKTAALPRVFADEPAAEPPAPKPRITAIGVGIVPQEPAPPKPQPVSRPKPPARGEDFASEPTLPQIPRAPLFGAGPGRAGSASDLILPSSLRAEALARIDEAFAEISDDAPHAAKPAVASTPSLVSEPSEVGTLGDEIMMEADPPPTAEIMLRRAPVADDAEPEIRVVPDEPSSPEILVVHSNRPVTANDTSHVAGTIDTDPES